MTTEDTTKPADTAAKLPETALKPTDVLELVRKAHPQLVNRLDEKAALTMVRATLRQLAQVVSDCPEGVVKVATLGNFRVRQVQIEKNGEKTSVRRVLFNAAKAPQPQAAASAEESQDKAAE